MPVESIIKKPKTKPIPLVVTTDISLDEFADAMAEKCGCKISKEECGCVILSKRNLRVYELTKTGRGSGIGVVAYGKDAAEKMIEESGCSPPPEKDYGPQ